MIKGYVNMTLAAIILAAGEGTRMRSKLPKVLHPLAGKPMIRYALDAVEGLVNLPPVLVVGHGADAVKAAIGADAIYALQAEQLGTGHAVLMAKAQLEGKADTLLVTLGDMPLLRGASLARLVELHNTSGGPVTMTSFIGDEARGFGRVVRNNQGQVSGIVEQAVATPEQLAIREYNVSAYCFDADWLWSALERVPVSPKGEYYLTDVVSLAVDAGFKVESMVLDDPEEAIGLNTRIHLAEAEKVMRKRINEGWMLAGVTIVDPATTYIDADVRIGGDSVILPNTYLARPDGDRRRV
jgi:bifunctional UDP-N-acetylglucosamine pyrophosphorylase / glucosamine-1-phosphate N-acetyltransferase